MNFTETEKRILNEFTCWSDGKNSFNWYCSDEICTDETSGALEKLEDEGYIFHWDDDYYHLTDKGLEAFRKICG